MSYAEIVARLVRDFGETVSLERDGAVLGEGKAIFRPILEERDQFVPTRLGVRREERVLCLGDASLPFDGENGHTVLRRGPEAYDVRNLRQVTVGREPVYWRAVLELREEEESL